MPEHTADHVHCPGCEALRPHIPAGYSELPFADAALRWLKTKTRIAPTTRSNYEYYIRTLKPFFGRIPLKEIHHGNIAAYIEERSANAGASAIRHEINTVAQVLDLAGLWTEIARTYAPPKLPKPTIGRVLTDAEERHLFRVAARDDRWRVAYLASILSVTTTAGPKEIRYIHLGDIDLKRRTIHLWDGLKNRHRERTVTLNDDALLAVVELIERAQKLGATEPHHFLLPGRFRTGSYVPTKPMLSWKKAWRSLCKAAGMPKLRRYDLRHHAITKMLENPRIALQVIIELAGHVTELMLKIYAHMRDKAKHKATDTLRLNLARVPKKLPQSVKKHAAGNLVWMAKRIP